MIEQPGHHAQRVVFRGVSKTAQLPSQLLLLTGRDPPISLLAARSLRAHNYRTRIFPAWVQSVTGAQGDNMAGEVNVLKSRCRTGVTRFGAVQATASPRYMEASRRFRYSATRLRARPIRLRPGDPTA